MSLVPENIINEILSRVDIVELISSYIPLKRAGRSYKALCPFHHEKTPSFVVNPERQIFHCFGCSQGGNAFSFIMQYERTEFPEAVETLAKKAGVVIPKSPSLQKVQNYSFELYRINEIAADFYHKQLSSQQGSDALAYLNNRGITKETVERFKLGYASDKWDALIAYLRAKNTSLSLIEKAGLIITKDSGGYYDRFRKRIVIPIMDSKGRVIAFGGRVLEEALPKYLNTCETPVYSKGKMFFGLNLSKDAICSSDSAVIVEGYFDLIASYQAGITNIVASCGTALTVEQVRLLKRYSHNVTMVYDSDEAGQAATLRSLELLLEEDVNVTVACLPKGYDPDSYLRAFGVNGFRQLIVEAKDAFDYRLQTLRKIPNAESITEKGKIASQMLFLINKFSNAVIKSGYIKRLAEILAVDENSLLYELKKSNAASVRSPSSYARPADEKALPVPSATERLIVKFMLEEQELIGRLRGIISPQDFRDKHLGQIVFTLFDLAGSGRKIEVRSLVNNFLDGPAAKIVSELTAYEAPKSEDKDRIIDDCIRRIKGDRCKYRRQELHEQIKQAQGRNDEDRLKELLGEFKSLVEKGI